MVLYSSTKFHISRPWPKIPKLIRFDLGFSQTSKKIYRKIQYKEKVFREFQRLPPFPRKMVLYSSTKFGVLKPWTNIPKLIRFDLGFWKTSKQIDRKVEDREKIFGEFKTFSSTSQKNDFVFVNQIWHFKALNQYYEAHKIRFRFLTNHYRTNTKPFFWESEVNVETL